MVLPSLVEMKRILLQNKESCTHNDIWSKLCRLSLINFESIAIAAL